LEISQREESNYEIWLEEIIEEKNEKNPIIFGPRFRERGKAKRRTQ
jgi:hypothetical protein